MSRLEIPLLGRVLWATGDLLLRGELELLLKTGAGTWEPQTFLADPGAEITTVPAYQAKQIALLMPQNAAAGAVHRQTGLEIRSGYLRVRVVGMDATEYAFPCLFVGDPDTPHATGSAAAPRKLLGLAGVVNKLRMAFDGRPTPGAPHGNLIVEKI